MTISVHTWGSKLKNVHSFLESCCIIILSLYLWSSNIILYPHTDLSHDQFSKPFYIY